MCAVGDFNFRGINWEGVIGDSGSEEFLKAVQNNLLSQVVTEPTWGANILDLVLTHDENIISEIGVEGELGSSDHLRSPWTGK